MLCIEYCIADMMLIATLLLWLWLRFRFRLWLRLWLRFVLSVVISFFVGDVDGISNELWSDTVIWFLFLFLLPTPFFFLLLTPFLLLLILLTSFSLTFFSPTVVLFRCANTMTIFIVVPFSLTSHPLTFFSPAIVFRYRGFIGEIWIV